MDNKKNRVLTLSSIGLFIGVFLLGILGLFSNIYEFSQAILIMIESACALVIIGFTIFIEKKWKINMSFPTRLVVIAFLILAIVLGEAFEFYYKIFWWDIFLHLFSGAGIAYLGFALARILLKDDSIRHKFFLCVLIGVLTSLSIELFWEILEFSVDSICGANMQKFMPEFEPLFNGGNSHVPLLGTDSELAEFYRNPNGYKFALEDTMEDIFCNFFGSWLFVLIIVLVNKQKNKSK